MEGIAERIDVHGGNNAFACPKLARLDERSSCGNEGASNTLFDSNFWDDGRHKSDEEEDEIPETLVSCSSYLSCGKARVVSLVDRLTGLFTVESLSGLAGNTAVIVEEDEWDRDTVEGAGLNSVAGSKSTLSGAGSDVVGDVMLVDKLCVCDAEAGIVVEPEKPSSNIAELRNNERLRRPFQQC